jgi:stage V sporulation protein S
MNANTPTPHGIHHREGQTVEDIARAPPGERVLKVSQNTQTNKLATSIGFVCEHGEAPLILALGPANVNTAVKAMAIARRKLKEENVDLRLYPTFRETDGAKRFSAILLQTWKEEGNGNMQPEDAEADVSLTCGANSVPSQVAGAIAGKIREGYSVSIRACGAEAVSKTVSAVTFARLFLADTEKNPPESTPLGRVVDISCAPEFRHETVGTAGDERTILMFTIKVINPRDAPMVSMSAEASGGISMERQRRLAEDANAGAANAAVNNGEEVSYCQQCGAVFNRMSANFCSQCGCKRG